MYPAIPFGPCGIVAGMGIYGGSSHHTTVTNTETATLTADNCFEDSVFCDWWDSAHRYQLTNSTADWVLGTPDTGWALDALIDCYLEEMTPAAAVDQIVADYDPTP